MKPRNQPTVGGKVLVSTGEFGAGRGKFTQEVEVAELLSEQFIAMVSIEGKDRTTFFFYRDRGVTWVNA